MATTLYVNKDTGSDSNDGLSTGAAKLTINGALSAIPKTGVAPTETATDVTTIYIKKPASGNYAGGDGSNGRFTLSIAGTKNFPVTIEGYETTPGDGTIVTIDFNNANFGASSWNVTNTIVSAGGNAYYNFKNLSLTNLSSSSTSNHAWGFSPASSFSFINCHAASIGGAGFWGVNEFSVICCSASGCGNYGYRGGTPGTVTGCVFHNCAKTAGTYPIFLGYGVVTNCLLYDNNTGGPMIYWNSTPGVVLHCTFDGISVGSSSQQGVYMNPSTPGTLVIGNCIFTNINSAIAKSAGGAGFHNLQTFGNWFYNVTTNYTNYGTGMAGFDETSGIDPQFVSPATAGNVGDYRLKRSSLARAKGYGVSFVTEGIRRMDLGGLQFQPRFAL